MFLHVSVILSTISGGRRNMYGWQAGDTHPTGMLSCYRPLTKLREGYVFTGVCNSVHRGGV